MYTFMKDKRLIVEIGENQIKILLNDEEVEKINRTFNYLDEDLKKIKRIFLRKKVNFIFKDDFFIKKELLDKEKLEYIDVKRYVKNELLEDLEEEKDFYSVNYFYNENEECEIFVYEEGVISNFIEFLLKENINVEEIYFSEKYILKDYKEVLKNNKKDNLFWIILIIGIVLGISYGGNLYYKKVLETQLEEVKNNFYSKEKILNSKKTDLENIKTEIEFLKKEISKNNIKNKKFLNEIMWIISIAPNSLGFNKVYWEKGNIIINGAGDRLEDILYFIKLLENDERIEKLNYDYIIKKENIYDFILELKVFYE
ncbi:hypothetical protein [Fusobacterium sp. FSA-380-WT-3A]|uniref:hypothetical protein n=1 Tax=Fusobacterium sp. FSA-380-WT-3A TaxID=2725304 RepID=UPI00147689DB|nr:hypothetical protein [Fusobacterium sp. FSA-380-WT-3A]NME36263.1 hypothetical protein [Fusobacterium sp. FSA-380-WT-3A]